MSRLNFLLKNKTEKTSTGCLNYTGYKNKKGYGRIKFEGRSLSAARVIYILKYGKFPENLDTCHKCDNPSCINPKHLFLGTRSENMIDCVQKGRSKNGNTGFKHGTQYSYWRKGCRCKKCCLWRPTYPSLYIKKSR